VGRSGVSQLAICVLSRGVIDGSAASRDFTRRWVVVMAALSRVGRELGNDGVARLLGLAEGGRNSRCWKSEPRIWSRQAGAAAIVQSRRRQPRPVLAAAGLRTWWRFDTVARRIHGSGRFGIPGDTLWRGRGAGAEGKSDEASPTPSPRRPAQRTSAVDFRACQRAEMIPIQWTNWTTLQLVDV